MSEESDLPLERLKALCPMRKREFTFGERRLDLWTACDLDPLLDHLMEKDESDPDRVDERMPYWAELWPSSILLCEVMIRHFPRLPRGPFLELGCGAALPSLLAATLGVTGSATDYLPEARWLAEANRDANDLTDRITVRHLDWRFPPSDPAPWILAGDIAYEERNFDPLLHCWDTLLAPGGEIWLGEPGRSVAKSFFAALEENGWRRETLATRERVAVHRISREPPMNFDGISCTTPQRVA